MSYDADKAFVAIGLVSELPLVLDNEKARHRTIIAEKDISATE